MPKEFFCAVLIASFSKLW